MTQLKINPYDRNLLGDDEINLATVLANVFKRVTTVDPALAAVYTIPDYPWDGSPYRDERNKDIAYELYSFYPKDKDKEKNTLSATIRVWRLTFSPDHDSFDPVTHGERIYFSRFYCLSVSYNYSLSGEPWKEEYPIVDDVCIVTGAPKSNYPLYQHIRCAVAGPI